MTTLSLAPEAFILLMLNNCTLSIGGGPIAKRPQTYSGPLHLECVTVPFSASDHGERDVYLLLRIGSFEAPLDPTKGIKLVIDDASDDGASAAGLSKHRTYRFNSSSSDTSSATRPSYADEGMITLSVVQNERDPVQMEDLETFDGILCQYAEFEVVGRCSSNTQGHFGEPVDAGAREYKGHPLKKASHSSTVERDDLRGHLVLVNEDNGEVVGQFKDGRIRIQEDPTLQTKGHEDDPVVVEIPDGGDEDAMQMFVRAIPPEEGDYISKGATIVSHAISHTTTLLLTTITAASNYYISRSAAATPTSTTSKEKGGVAVPAEQSKAVIFLSSARTRKNLATVHAFTGQAVKVSAKTASIIDDMIKHAIGSGSSRGASRSGAATSAASSLSAPRTSSPSVPAVGAPPPPYSEKPSLPPRKVDTPVGASPSRKVASPSPALPPRPGPLSKKARIILSADLILSTLEQSAKRIMDGGGDNLNAIVAHKYGSEAAQSSGLVAGSAKHVVLVYIDMRGIGRKALLKRVGKEYVKGKMRR